MNITRKNHDFEAEFSLNEVRFIHQAFNEVCHGLRVTDFDTKIGDINEAKREMKKFGSFYEDAKEEQVNVPVRIHLDSGQLWLYRNVLKTVCEEIEEWEFQTRTGETRKRAMEIHNQLREILDEMQRV